MTPIERPPCPPYLVPFLADAGRGTDDGRRRLRSGFDRLMLLQAVLKPVEIKALRAKLSQTFENKCCYCESALGVSAEGEIELFRPKGPVQGQDGRSQEPIYGQLAADWRNLYLSCPTCNRNKANRFPVDGERAAPGATYDEVVSTEQAFLLDPCRDNPDQHLVFLPDGTVAGRTARGRTTVEVLALNRVALVNARRAAANQYLLDSQAGRNAPGSAQPYLAVWRQVVASKQDPGVVQEIRSAAVREQQELDQRRQNIATDRGQGLENYKARAAYIERVRIENFGPIRRLDLQLEESTSDQAPCFALLGINGVGKSTVLRAIALTLSGRPYIERLRLPSKRLLSAGSVAGEVRISFSDGAEVIMRLRRGRPITFNVEGSRSLVLAYGATRLLPRGRHKAKPGFRHAKIDNLFDPFLPLTSPSDWLSGLSDEKLLEVSQVISGLLPPDGPLSFERTLGGQVSVRVADGAGHTVTDLSDGFQSLLGMVVDIMEVMYAAEYESMQVAQGIVLIDEMGNHFHPAWRVRIVSSLRRVFPCIQFVFSTHDPLCLRGLVKGEVAVLMRDRLGQIYALEDLPAVDRLSIEQLLSSEHFGLESTIDPKLADIVRRYESLSQKADLTAEENEELDEATRELTDIRYLGRTRRERIALQLLDLGEVGFAVPETRSVKVEALSSATVAKLRRLMGSIEPSSREAADDDQG